MPITLTNIGVLSLSMVMADVMINEILTFYIHYFDNTPKCNILNVVVGFYTTEEVAQAKKLLFDVVGAIENMQDVRHVQRRTGDNKRKLDADDIYDLLVLADQAKVALPCFAAKNLSQVPSINPSEADICALAASMGHLKAGGRYAGGVEAGSGQPGDQTRSYGC